MSAKVFVIGFHKTGTTSMGAALKMLGYRLDHRLWKDEVAKLPQPVTRDSLLARAMDVAGQADAFEDNPWPLFFAEMDAAFPGAKFILTRRAPGAWFESMVKHFGDKPSLLRGLIYGDDAAAPKGHAARYLCRYQRHIDEVLQYFAGRENDLLIVELEQAGWADLCAFLDKPVPGAAFPKAGTGARRARGRWLKRLLGRT